VFLGYLNHVSHDRINDALVNAFLQSRTILHSLFIERIHRKCNRKLNVCTEIVTDPWSNFRPGYCFIYLKKGNYHSIINKKNCNKSKAKGQKKKKALVLCTSCRSPV
jgi:hypothetical protein